MFIVIRKVASLGHEFDADDYSDHSCVVCETLEQAVAEYLDWCAEPRNKFGYNSAAIFREGLPNDKQFIKDCCLEKARQRREITMASFSELVDSYDEDYTPHIY